MYTRNEVFQATLKYFGGDELAANVWTDKYCLKNQGEYLELTPEDMHRRLAKEFARIEAKYKNPLSENEIFDLLKDFKYLVPQGSPMAGIGNPYAVTSISNCFVIGGHSDSYGGIMNADEQQVQLMKRRGGVGQDLSHIRPSGAVAGNSPLGNDSGMPLFMERFSNSTREVQQDGRRGALMLSIDIKHPDAEKFVDKKMIEGKVTGANVSVKISEDFMGCVEQEINFIQTFPVDLELEDIIQNVGEKVFFGELLPQKDVLIPVGEINGVQAYFKKVNAKQLWQKIVYNAWKSAEPGILFWDQILEESAAAAYGDEWSEVSTNPCFTGDTLVVTQKGEPVSFKELAKTGESVNVYCIDHNGLMRIRKMRNPRLTGKDKQIFKLVFEDGSFVRATANHKFYKSDLTKTELQNLVAGDEIFAISENKKYIVKEILEDGFEDVYNGTVDDFHNYFVLDSNGVSALLSANCGEIPLPAYDSCRLLAINLASYVQNPFTKSAFVDLDLLKNHSQKAQRLMDDIVDLEIEKVERILKAVKAKTTPIKFRQVEIDLWENILKKAVDGRRTGLGVLGEGDLIAKVGVKYGSKEGTLFAERIHQVVATEAFKSSIQLAKERGAFPIWKYDDVEKSGFLNRILNENGLMTDEDKLRYAIHGRRNVGLLTIAPTGSTSLLTQTTSGIEPLFAPYYFRKKKIKEGEAYDYTDEMGDKWAEFVVFHKPFIEWYAAFANAPKQPLHIVEGWLKSESKENLKTLFEQSPYFQATAQDVDYVEKVAMQGAVQKWVDHSISVTVNMPEHVTEQMVSDVYKKAFEVGCKGITVYRENSRGNVLSTESVKGGGTNDTFEYTDAVKRPKTVACDVFFGKARKDEFVALVGLVNGKPYEVFCVPSGFAAIDKTVKKGTIEKIGTKQYRFVCRDGKNVIENITDLMIETEQNETRSLSGMLRHRMKPIFIADMMKKFVTISTSQSFLEKVIRSYVDDGISDPCPECGANMVMTEGCMKCAECGHAKCG